MIDDSPKPNDFSHRANEATSATRNVRFFHRTDWLSFGITTVLALTVYLGTLAPNVTLGFSGILSVGAMYAGVPHPPGYPLWTLYAWVFTELLPFSNIAWRAAVASAVAAALACGFISLFVSRGGAAMVEDVPGVKKLEPREQNALRMVCGFAAGIVFGLNGTFWGRAVVADA